MRQQGPDYYNTDQDLIKSDLQVRREHYKAKGFRVLVDGTQITRRTAPATAKILAEITGRPKFFRNLNGELAINYEQD